MPPIVMLGLIQQGLESGLGEAPRARIQRFLLRPDDGLGVGVGVEVFLELGPGERVELLHAGDCGRFEVIVGGAVLVEGGVDLAGAHDDAVDFVVGFDVAGLVSWVGDDPLEVGVACEVGDGRSGEGMAEERFGEEEDESWGLRGQRNSWIGEGTRLTFSELAIHLSP